MGETVAMEVHDPEFETRPGEVVLTATDGEGRVLHTVRFHITGSEMRKFLNFMNSGMVVLPPLAQVSIVDGDYWPKEKDVELPPRSE